MPQTIGPVVRAFHPHAGTNMLHDAPANRSDIPRRALILAIGVPGEPRAEPKSFPWLEEKKTARMERREQTKATTS